MDKDHAFKRFNRELKEDRLPRLLLLYGEEQLQVDWAVKEIVNKYVNSASHSLDVNTFEGLPDIGELVEACETLTMLSEKRVVVVADSYIFKGASQGADEAYMEKLFSYLTNIPETTVLIFKEREVDARLKSYKTAAALGGVYDFKRFSERDDTELLKGFIRNRFKRLQKNVDEGMVNLIIQVSGYFNQNCLYNLYNLEKDIEKIAAHSGDKDPEPCDVRATLKGDLEAYIFSFVEALGKEDRKQALLIYSNMSERGESFYMILSLLISQYELLLDMKQYIEKGVSVRELENILKANPYRLKKALPVVSRYSEKELIVFLERLFDMDRNNKRGLMDPRLAMELFIGEM